MYTAHFNVKTILIKRCFSMINKYYIRNKNIELFHSLYTIIILILTQIEASSLLQLLNSTLLNNST